MLVVQFGTVVFVISVGFHRSIRRRTSRAPSVVRVWDLRRVEKDLGGVPGVPSRASSAFTFEVR